MSNPVLKSQEEAGLKELTPEDRVQIDAIKRQVDLKSSDSVLTYGSSLQKNLADFATGALDHIRNKDGGEVGKLLSELMQKVRTIDVSKLRIKKPGILDRIFGELLGRARSMITRYEKVNTQIAEIQTRLGTAQEGLVQDIALMEGLYEQNVSYFRNLELYIHAGEEMMNDVREVQLPELERQVRESKDPLAQQHYSDLQQQLQRFERRVHDLKLSRTVAIQTLPQIRLIQHNNQQLAEKIQSSLLNTLPLWRNQLVVGIALCRQSAALEFQKSVSDTTNDLLKKNSTLLKENSIQVARENERGIVDMETIRQTQKDLMDTVDSILAIQQEARRNRASAEKELLGMEEELKTKLLQKPESTG